VAYHSTNGSHAVNGLKLDIFLFRPLFNTIEVWYMNDAFKVAAIQMVSTPEVEQNFSTARRLVAEAAEQGATLVLLPEYWPLMGLHEKVKLEHAEQNAAGKIQSFMAALAREHGIWLIGGTLPMASDETGKGA